MNEAIYIHTYMHTLHKHIAYMHVYKQAVALLEGKMSDANVQVRRIVYTCIC